MYSNKTPIVVDIGSSIIKAGFIGTDLPSLVFPNYFGEFKYPSALNFIREENEKLIGNDCKKYLGVLKLKYPVSHGLFLDKNSIGPLFKYIYKKLKIDLDEIKEHPLLIAEPMLSPEKYMEDIINELYAEFKTNYFLFASQPILSMFSTSKTTGAILESGGGLTQSCLISEGYSIPGTYKRINLGGKEITENLQMLLCKKGYNFNKSDNFLVLNSIKEEVCDLNVVDKNTKIENVNYKLPDDTIIEIGEERYLAPNILFNPLLNEFEYPGIHEILFDSISKTNVELKLKFYNSIILTGGNTKMKGYKERLNHEMKKITPKNLKIRLHSPNNPEFSPWIGGNIISSMENTKKMWVSYKEYYESGRIPRFSTIV